MVYDPANKPENPYARIYANFLEQTKEHVLTVITDDGLNRRMRVAAPGTNIWSWSVITWPGYLATYGDVADGFMFTRDTDMIDFFDRRDHRSYYSDGAPSIDFRYWAEKLSGSGRYRSIKEYSSEKFLAHVKSVLAESDELGDEAEADYQRLVAVTKRVCAANGVDFAGFTAAQRQRQNLRRNGVTSGLVYDRCPVPELTVAEDDEEARELFGEVVPEQSPAERRAEILEEARRYAETEHQAQDWLYDQDRYFGEDPWDADLREYTTDFLFACYAIDLTVKLWREYEQTPEAAARRDPGDSYVLVDGGLVQNDPALPVFDLDILGSGNAVKDVADELVNLYERINAHPKARVNLADTLTKIAKMVRAEAAPEWGETIDELEAKRLGAQQDAEVPA